MIELWSLTNDKPGSEQLASLVGEKSLSLSRSSVYDFFVILSWLSTLAVRSLALGRTIENTRERVLSIESPYDLWPIGMHE